jgi:hypothetical protein
MVRDVVYESELISVWCYPELGVIHHQMHGPCSGPAFRAALIAGVQAMQRCGATCWLSDDRANGALPEQDEMWATKIWSQQAKAAGWAAWAMVVPANALGQLNVARFVEMQRKRGVEAQMFSDPAPALAWLQEQHCARKR